MGASCADCEKFTGFLAARANVRIIQNVPIVPRRTAFNDGTVERCNHPVSLFLVHFVPLVVYVGHMRKRYAYAVKQQAAAMVGDRVPVVTIAKRLGVHCNTIGRWLNAHPELLAFAKARLMKRLEARVGHLLQQARLETAKPSPLMRRQLNLMNSFKLGRVDDFQDGKPKQIHFQDISADFRAF